MPKLIKDYIDDKKYFDTQRTTLLEDVENVFSDVDFGQYDVVNLSTVPHSKIRTTHALSDRVNKKGVYQNFVALKANTSNARTLQHEYLHLFGLPDLYWPHFNEPNPAYPKLHKLNTTDPFDRMGGGKSFDYSLIGIQQYFLGWLRDKHVEIIDNGWEGVLNPILSDEGTTMLMYSGTQKSASEPIVYCIEVSNTPNRNGIIVYRVIPTNSSGQYPIVFARREGSKNPNIFFPGDTWKAFDTMENAGPNWRDNEDLISVEILEQVGDSFRIKVKILD
jgi:hypothetical protein